MAKFKCKGEDLKPFVKALSVLGKDVREFRIESNGALLQGSAVPESHNALIIAKMNMEGLLTEEMENLVLGVDMRHFKTLVDLASAEDELEVVMDLGRFNIKIGRHIQRSFPLNAEIPKELDPKVIPPFTWTMPAESMKPVVKALDLDDKYAKLIVRLMDAGLMMSTETYGATARASYTIPMDMLESDKKDMRFKAMYPFDDFATLKDLPADGPLTFRSGEALPLEVLANTGRLSVRAMYAPLIETP